MSRWWKPALVLSRKLLAALFLVASVFVFETASAPQADAKGVRSVYTYQIICREGWWAVRDGGRHMYPSDGKWRPSWFTRCYRVIVPNPN